MNLDFEGLAFKLLGEVRTLLPAWLPGGKLKTTEYVCGDLTGGSGTSLSININTGKWADFSTDHRGGDLISLYAAIRGIEQGEAFKELNTDYQYKPVDEVKVKKIKKDQAKAKAQVFEPPPHDMGLPFFDKSSTVYEYLSLQAETLNFIERIDKKDGSKFMLPWSWSVLTRKWVKKQWPDNRPLYGLEQIGAHPNKPILLVEGEKACLHAREYMKVYNVLTWSGGSKAINKADWKPIHGKKLLLWPDADKPGIDAMEKIAEMLHVFCPEIKVLDVSNDTQDGSDSVDYGFIWGEFVPWAKKRAYVYPKAITAAEVIEAPENDAPMPEYATDYEQKVMNEIVERGANAIAPSDSSYQAAWDTLGIKYNKKTGSPYCNIETVGACFKTWTKIKDVFWYDEFHRKVFTNRNLGPGETCRPIEEYDELWLLYRLQRDLGLHRIKHKTVTDAIAYHISMKENHMNAPKDWFETLVWDEVERVENFAHKYLGTEDNEYTRAVSSNLFVSMIARIYQPGCKVDNMVVLEGKQGARKSTALRVLGGDWFKETNESPSSKDFYLGIQGSILVEVAELDSFNKAGVDTIKNLLTIPSDKFRPPYGRHVKEFKRQCVFVGTTNKSEYLRDSTGARRFWPLKVKTIDIEGISKDRAQLFAEAVHKYKAGEKWYEVPESALIEQENRQEVDAWEAPIAEFIGQIQIAQAQIPFSESAPEFNGRGYNQIIHDIKNRGYLTQMDVAEHALKLPIDRQNLLTVRRISPILTNLGLERKRGKIKGTSLNEWRYHFD